MITPRRWAEQQYHEYDDVDKNDQSIAWWLVTMLTKIEKQQFYCVNNFCHEMNLSLYIWINDSHVDIYNDFMMDEIR